jgi:hypothetical protein
MTSLTTILKYIKKNSKQLIEQKQAIDPPIYSWMNADINIDGKSTINNKRKHKGEKYDVKT